MKYFLLILFCLSFSAHADTCMHSTPRLPDSSIDKEALKACFKARQPPSPPHNLELEAAVSECYKSTIRDPDGYPNTRELKNCLQFKGFAK